MVMEMLNLHSRVRILGTEYTVIIASKEDDAFLNSCDGYCDKTSKKIVIKEKDKNNELDLFEEYQKKIMRHEIIHAFLFESGLHENFKHEEWGHDETMIDWVAAQFPKILKAFKEVDAL